MAVEKLPAERADALAVQLELGMLAVQLHVQAAGFGWLNKHSQHPKRGMVPRRARLTLQSCARHNHVARSITRGVGPGSAGALLPCGLRARAADSLQAGPLPGAHVGVLGGARGPHSQLHGSAARLGRAVDITVTSAPPGCALACLPAWQHIVYP